MDTELLVEQKDDGRKLIEQLARDGFEVAAAFWVLRQGRLTWQLYIASSWVDEKNSTEPYRRLLASRAKIPLKGVMLSDLELLNSENPIVKAAVEIRDRDPDGRAVAYEGERLGDMAIQGAYIYPEIKPARLLFTVRYARIDDTNRWNAEAHYDGFYPDLRAKGAISYTVAGYKDELSDDVRQAHVGVLVEIDPRFTPFSPGAQSDFLTLAARQARRAADGMFKARHPDAVVVEPAEEHCLTP